MHDHFCHEFLSCHFRCVRFRVSYNLEQTKRTCCRVGSRRLAAAAVVVIEAVIVDQVRLQQRVVE